MKKAIFLDRDGTINKLIFNRELNEFEPPHHPETFELIQGATDALLDFLRNDFLLYVVSNQPDFAKGKTTLENLKMVHDKFEGLMKEHGIHISGFYYCYHHPDGIVKDYSFVCDCRKPSPYFVNKVIEENGIDRASSWFIGDRESDVLCGKLAGLNSVFLTGGQGESAGGTEQVITASGLMEAAVNILNHNKRTICHQ